MRIKRFFGEDDHDKREAALDDLHIALLLKYTRPKSYSIDTQLVTFKILIAMITRYPGLRRHFCDHKDLRNSENQSGTDFENLWRRHLQSCGEEWNFYRELAAFCISENDLAKLVEADKPSEVAVVKLEEGNLNKVPIETLLGWCRSGPEFEPPRICAIHHLGGILALPSFWQKGRSDEERFLVVLSDISVDVCCPQCDIITLLMSGENIKACFPSASEMASSIRDLLAQSLANPSTTNPSPRKEGEISRTVDEETPVLPRALFSVATTSTKSPRGYPGGYSARAGSDAGIVSGEQRWIRHQQGRHQQRSSIGPRSHPDNVPTESSEISWNKSNKELENEAEGQPSGATTPSNSSSFFNVTSQQPSIATEPKSAAASTASRTAVYGFGLEVNKVLPPIPRDFAASPVPVNPGEVDHAVFESMVENTLSLRFEIKIVKVPWLPLHRIQFRRGRNLANFRRTL
ncbi:Non-specific serine/threonine protein kinase [Mycena venus]|uniref:Non-specific serine/threonine protein kinase n=1 Tax=Mycena venus TaxID=2733690 RepID=A0A8H7CFT3_9AGAR|nr:Non-specific serine/threonine protein kinase [Mycena venus]